MWKEYLNRPDEKDHRAWWRLWNLYRDRPRLRRVFATCALTVFSPDGRHVAIAFGGVISVHASLSGREETSVRISPATADDIAFAPDNTRLAVTHQQGGIVTVWGIVGPSEKVAEVRSDMQPKVTAMRHWLPNLKVDGPNSPLIR